MPRSPRAGSNADGEHVGGDVGSSPQAACCAAAGAGVLSSLADGSARTGEDGGGGHADGADGSSPLTNSGATTGAEADVDHVAALEARPLGPQIAPLPKPARSPWPTAAPTLESKPTEGVFAALEAYSGG